MIYETLQILKEQLDPFFVSAELGQILEIENIALWDAGGSDSARLKGKVLLTLINVEEEITMKNLPAVRVVNHETEYKNPPVNLNLFLLISANCEKYDKSLRSVATVIEFFQGKKVFTSANTVYKRDNVAFGVLDDFTLKMDLFTPSFEDLNHIWATLGGKQLPSVIYKIQMIEIDHDKPIETTGVITKVQNNIEEMNI